MVPEPDWSSRDLAGATVPGEAWSVARHWGLRLVGGGLAACLVGFFAGESIAGGFDSGVAAWLLAAPADTLVALLVLVSGLLAATVVRPARKRIASPAEASPGGNSPGSGPRSASPDAGPDSGTNSSPGLTQLGSWIRDLAGVIGLSAAVCWWGAGPLRGLPPAFHDEYSYLFQAATYLDGRLSYESPPLRELFDQVHVLNEGRLASRYFPATGLWLAPWLALGWPALGWWFAQMLLTGLVYAWGRDLAGRGCGLLAAGLCAVSPGLVLFSQLLLAHHPTLLGLVLFHWASLRFCRQESRGWALLAGVGLMWAMLCRPMTAAGAALPVGLWLLWRGFWDRRGFALWLPLGGPLLLGLAIQAGCNLAITGRLLETPYGLYTRLHTPRHVYGFHNVTRGERRLGPRVHDQYDRWAENLTGELAVRNVQKRLWTSGQWTLGVLPLLFVVGGSWAAAGGLPRELWWLPASILSLHLVHVPYWFDGIFHFHYVFETLPLWLVWLSLVAVRGSALWRRSGRTWLPVWGALALLANLGVAYTVPQGLWNAPFLAGRGQLEFAKRRHAQFVETVTRGVTERPALVLIEPDPADRHLDYVTNLPPLTGPILLARDQPGLPDRATIARAYPDRVLYRYRAATGELTRWSETARSE